MKMEKLVIKDLVTIGVFTVIYFVLMFLSGMVGMVPILYLAYPTLAGIITGIVIMLFMVIAELLRKKGEYKSFKCNMLSFAVFNTWICGFLMQILLAKDKVIGLAETRGMGHDYIMKLIALVNYRSMILVYIGAIVGGIVGAYIGKVFLKKHFEKAGIV